MSAYLSYLYRSGEKRVYGQIVTFESRRGEKMFERYGFKVLNRAEITKYKAFYPESHLSTVIKNLETAEPPRLIREHAAEGARTPATDLIFHELATTVPILAEAPRGRPNALKDARMPRH
jgi:hypothetical protein